MKAANPAVEPNAATTDVATAVADEQEVEHELPDLSSTVIGALFLKIAEFSNDS